MANDRDVVLVEGVRTPFVKSDNKFKDVHPAELGRVAVHELLERSGVKPDSIDEVIMGNTGTPSDAVNLSRVIALRAGIPQRVPAVTVHRNCASALESVTTAYERIRAGTCETVVAGGSESMSQLPMIMSKPFVQAFQKLMGAKSPTQQMGALWNLIRTDLKQAVELVTTSPLQSTDYKPRIAVVEGLTDPFVGINMGSTAELLAKEWNISRAEQDEYALRSHQKAVAATKSGRLAEEMTPVFLPPSFKEYVAQDIGPRAEQTIEQLAKLKPFFDKKYGSVTVGNACPITDGAGAVLLMSRAKAMEAGMKPIASIKSYAFAGCEPERMGLGPAYATPIALKRAGLSLKDIGLVELNEAFAAQVISCVKALDSDEWCKNKLGLAGKVGAIDPATMNPNGGAIALGHPVGATGTRLVITLMREMQKKSVQFGLATLCIGGGQGGAVILEREA
jgi:acetyl-CoA acyltransferase